MEPSHLTERQRQWFASVRATLEASTGRTLEQWAELARACPETAHRRRLAWMKQTHGLGQNYASMVLNSAFPAATAWSDPDALEAALWADPAARRIFELIRTLATALPDVITGQRRGYTAFSRNFQFAAARPVKTTVRLGLAVASSSDLAVQPPGRDSWSERLQAVVVFETPDQVDRHAQALLRAAWERA